MLSCSTWFSAPSSWIGGGLESRCIGRVCSADGALQSHGTIRTTPTQRLSRPPPIQENRMLQLNI